MVYKEGRFHDALKIKKIIFNVRTIAKGKKKSPTDSNFILPRNFAWLDFLMENSEKNCHHLEGTGFPM